MNIENIEKVLKVTKATRLVFQYFPERKTYIFEVGLYKLYKSKVWVVSAYGRTPDEAFSHLIKRLTEKRLYNAEGESI